MSKVVPGYVLLGDAHPGGTSVVWRARSVDTDEIVAVKVADRLHDESLEREIEIGARIRHRNLSLPTTGGVLADGRRWAASPWIDGPRLSDAVGSDRRWPIHRVISLADDLAAALDALHRGGVVHRDVTPANVILADDRAVLIDLGLGRHGDSTVTADGDLAGTPRYLAPEVIRGDAPTARSDQYAVALVLAEAATGSWPFPDTGSAATALHHQLSTAPTPIDELRPDAPPGLVDAIGRALAKDPADRWPDVAAFADACARDSDRLASTRSDGRRRRTLLLGVGVAVVVAGAAVIATVTSRTDEESTTVPQASPIPASIVSGSPAGAAADLGCNLVDDAGFESGFVSDNFFDNPDPALDGRERVVPSGGVDGSAALVVGDPGRYGRFG
ncbi:MAG: serine/threonine-protein kinase, partial [Actinomycetota bacterium]